MREVEEMGSSGFVRSHIHSSDQHHHNKLILLTLKKGFLGLSQLSLHKYLLLKLYLFFILTELIFVLYCLIDLICLYNEPNMR